MCLDSLNWALWVRFHGRYWYQSFIDGSNIWGVDRTDPWGPEMDHPPLGRSYLVGDSCCYMALIIVTCQWNTSAAAKYELYILLPVEQRCSKKCVAALQADTFVCLYIYIYIHHIHQGRIIYKFIRIWIYSNKHYSRTWSWELKLRVKLCSVVMLLVGVTNSNTLQSSSMLPNFYIHDSQRRASSMVVTPQ